MEPQAKGPEQSQVQTPVHPIHEETAVHERLTKLVRETPDNDPHEGTDLEQPKAPPKEEEAKPEVEAEAKEEETETLEIDEDAPIFEVHDLDDKGKKVKVSLKQLREERMMKADYHRNIQKVKSEEAAIPEKIRAEVVKSQQDYLQRLETHKQAVQRLAGAKTLPEIEALSRQDPAAAQQEFLRMISVNQTLQQIEAEQGQVRQKLAEEQQTAIKAAIQKSRQTLESDIKGWDEKMYQDVLSTVSKDYGFEGQDVAQVYDSRLIKVFHDAYQYRQLQKAKPEISKKVVAVPKVVKPGSAEKPNTSNEVQELAARLAKTGKGEDFVALQLAKQKLQKRNK
jgi:hypothetical protein